MWRSSGGGWTRLDTQPENKNQTELLWRKMSKWGCGTDSVKPEQRNSHNASITSYRKLGLKFCCFDEHYYPLLSFFLSFLFFSFLFLSCLVCLSVWLSVCLSVCLSAFRSSFSSLVSAGNLRANSSKASLLARTYVFFSLCECNFYSQGTRATAQHSMRRSNPERASKWRRQKRARGGIGANSSPDPSKAKLS